MKGREGRIERETRKRPSVRHRDSRGRREGRSSKEVPLDASPSASLTRFSSSLLFCSQLENLKLSDIYPDGKGNFLAVFQQKKSVFQILQGEEDRRDAFIALPFPLDFSVPNPLSHHPQTS